MATREIGPNPNPLYTTNEDGKLKWGDRIQQSTIYDAESQLIRGTMSFSKDKLQELDPSYTGYTHVFVLRLPEFMTAIADGRLMEGYDGYKTGKDDSDKLSATSPVAIARAHCRNLKTLFELGSTSYSGTPDLQMQVSQVATGFNERNYPAPTTAAYDSTSFTLRCLETRGEPLRRALEYYVNGVTDANVKATMLHGALNADKTAPMDPTLANYTFSIMVVQTDQTNLRIQDISVWPMAIVTNVERSNYLDWTNGEIDIVQPQDVQFSGVYLPDSNNEYITAKAMKLLGRRMRLYRRFKDLTADQIGIDSWQDGGEFGYNGSSATSD